MTDRIAEIVEWQLSQHQSPVYPPPSKREACGVCHIVWTGLKVCPECGRNSA